MTGEWHPSWRIDTIATMALVVMAGLAACTSSSGISTCGQYLSANNSSRSAYVQSIDSQLALNPGNTSYWLTGITTICQQDGAPTSDIKQLLMNLGYLGPGQ